MSKTITLRLDNETYKLFQAFALADNRPISNLIETSAKRHLEECTFVSDTEMQSILRDSHLVEKLRRGSLAARKKKGKLIG